VLSTNMGIKPALASAPGLKLSENVVMGPYMLIGWLLNIVMVFWKHFYCGCLKMCL
jgi:hypothetical protein